MGIGQTSYAWIGEQQENVISSSQRKIVNHCGRLADDGPGERVFFFFILCHCCFFADVIYPLILPVFGSTPVLSYAAPLVNIYGYNHFEESYACYRGEMN